MRRRHARLRGIQALDPARDYLTIYQTMVRYEFPSDMKLGLNLAFNRSYALPPIAKVLARSGEITRRTRKRIDDTGLLMYEIILHGHDHPRSLTAISRINAMHGQYRIPNELYLYVLACLVVVPTRWIQRFGWRDPCCHERAATAAFYRELGRRMGITELPSSYDAFAAWFDDFDELNLQWSEQAVIVERATRSLMLGRLPRLAGPLGDRIVSALYDARLREATGAPNPTVAVRALLYVTLKARAAAGRYFGRPKSVPLFADGIATPTYPNGYKVEDLGTLK